MNGEILPVWSRTWSEIWLRLSRSSVAPNDLFMEFVATLASPPRQPTPPPLPPSSAYDADGQLTDVGAIQLRQEYEKSLDEYAIARSEYATALTSEDKAKAYFRKIANQVATETEAISLLESAFSALEAYGNDGLLQRYRALVSEFIRGFSLRYEIRNGFSLHATIPGVFCKVISELKKLAAHDAHIKDLLSEFEEAFADLRSERTQAKIKSSLQKQFNLLEALGQKYPGVTETTLGAICNQLDWPHATVKEVGKKLYGFRSNYPGLGHGGSSIGVLRPLDMRDFVSLSLILASLTPYLAYGLNSETCYTA